MSHKEAAVLNTMQNNITGSENFTWCLVALTYDQIRRTDVSKQAVYKTTHDSFSRIFAKKRTCLIVFIIDSPT